MEIASKPYLLLCSNNNANTGIFGTGYAELGIVGMIISVILLALIISIFNIFSKEQQKLKDMLLLPVILQLVNVGIVQIFLTNGIFISLLYVIANNKIKLSEPD